MAKVFPKSVRSWAHLSFGIVFIGLFVNLINSRAYVVSLSIWGLSAILGVITLIINRRVFPKTAHIVRRDPNHLDILGYIEVYLALLPLIIAIILLVYIFYFK